jgi:hypothetical protein
MQIEVLADPDAVVGRAAALIAKEARTVVPNAGVSWWRQRRPCAVDDAPHARRTAARPLE